MDQTSNLLIVGVGVAVALIIVGGALVLLDLFDRPPGRHQAPTTHPSARGSARPSPWTTPGDPLCLYSGPFGQCQRSPWHTGDHMGHGWIIGRDEASRAPHRTHGVPVLRRANAHTNRTTQETNHHA